MSHKPLFVLCYFILNCVCFNSDSDAQDAELRYKAPKQVVHYDITITMDTPTEMKTFQGQTVYKGVSSNPDKVTMRFSGKLNRSTKMKQRSGRFGIPRFGGPPRRSGFPFGPFSASTALQQTTAKIELTPQGEFLALSGESQIPLPLGHLSLLVFETLPVQPQESWTSDNGILLGEKNNSGSRFPRPPFGPRGVAEKTSSGSESAKYKVTSQDGHRVTIEKQYELDSPNSDPPFTFGGKGSVVFDSEVGMFASADLKYDLKVSSKNVDVRIPVTVKYRMVSQEEVTERARKKKEAADAALAKGMATARAGFASMSEDEIAAIYKNGGKVPPTGLMITPKMDVPIGLLAQYKWPNKYEWWAIEVIAVFPNELIKFKGLSSGKFYVRNRNTLSLAQEFVEQPDVSKTDLQKLIDQSTASAKQE